jgi:chaperone BCS1
LHPARSHHDIYSILTRNRKIVNALLLEAKRAYSEKTEQSVCVYVNDQMDNWRHVACRAKRPLRSIILDPGVKDLLLEDARDFLASKQWYADRGIPHRRGYLLYGKPGSGKTSLIQAIAGELGLHVYIISLSRAGLDDTTLSSAIGDLPGRCIALMEDIDAAFHRGITREQEEEAPADDESGEASGPSDKPSAPKGPPASRVTLSGLLNALDGVGAQEGRILFATTNRYTALDDALIRPGRLDLHVEFKHASTFQIEELFRTFYQPDIRKTKEEAAKDAAKKTGSKIEEVTVDVISEKKDEVEDVTLIDLDLTSVDVEKPAVAPPTPSSSRSVSPDASPALPTISDLPGVTAAGPILSSATTKSGNVAFGTSHSARAPSLSEAQYDSLTKKFSAQIPSDMFSMAALQGYLMTYKIRPVDAVKDVKAWVEKERADRKKAAKGSQPRKVVEKKEEKEKEAAVVAEPESSS